MTARQLVAITRNWAVLAIAIFAVGCSNKGKYADKVNVVVSDQLKEQGVFLVDWRFSDSQDTFGIKLKTNEPVKKQTYLSIKGPEIGELRSMGPVGNSINKGEWIDYGGSEAFGNAFENFPANGTITIDTFSILSGK